MTTGPALDFGAPRRYRVRAVLGRGGFGTVYAGEMIGGAGVIRPIALKVPSQSGLKVHSLERLVDEARILAQLRCDGIVAVDNIIALPPEVQERLGGEIALVMERVDGLPLSALQEPGRRVPPRTALEIVARLATALDYAWNAVGSEGRPLHVVHRDVKPSNVMITARGEVKLLDFGIARGALPERATPPTTTRVAGSTGYVAPERLAGLGGGPEVDIYNLGVLLYELVAGEGLGPLVSGPAIQEARYRRQLALRMETVEDAIGDHAGLRRMVEQLLALDPADRPSARDVAVNCERLLVGLDGPTLRVWAEQAIEASSEPVADPEAPDLGVGWEEPSVFEPPAPRPPPPPPPPPTPAVPVPPPARDPWLRALLREHKKKVAALVSSTLLALGATSSDVVVERFTALLNKDADADRVERPADCADQDPAIHPGAPERCDGQDQDCDQEIDEGVQLTLYADSDGDGVGDGRVTQAACAPSAGWVLPTGDCDDQNEAVAPGRPEIAGNGLDDDCDPATVDAATPAPTPPTPASALSTTAPRNATVEVLGEAARDLQLHAGSRAVALPSSRVPAGVWEIRGRNASLPNAELTVMGSLSIAAGEHVRLRCTFFPVASCLRE